jgi:hypothetical protein
MLPSHHIAGAARQGTACADTELIKVYRPFSPTCPTPRPSALEQIGEHGISGRSDMWCGAEGDGESRWCQLGVDTDANAVAKALLMSFQGLLVLARSGASDLEASTDATFQALAPTG